MPEETDKYIRIPVAECDITATIDISKDEGIKALYCGKEKKVATYLFLKEKGWTMEKAKKWVKEHKEKDSIDLAAYNIDNAEDIFDLTEGKEMNKEREVRTFTLDDIEVRSEDDKSKIKGHAAVFDKLSEDLGGFREKIASGAFAKTIKKSDIRALFNHDPNYVLGRNKAGTLTLEEDEKGLAIEIDPPDTSYAKDLMVSIERGDITQMSFAFKTIKDSWANQDKKESIRTLEEVDLFDVSPVTYPAYPQTDVKVRSFLEEAGLDVEKLAVIMEKKTAANDEDIAVVKQAINVLNSYLPEDSDGQGAPDEGYVGRLEIQRMRLEVSKPINKEVTSGKIS